MFLSSSLRVFVCLHVIKQAKWFLSNSLWENETNVSFEFGLRLPPQDRELRPEEIDGEESPLHFASSAWPVRAQGAGTDVTYATCVSYQSSARRLWSLTGTRKATSVTKTWGSA